MRDPGPCPTSAVMAQLVAVLQNAGLVEVSLDDEGEEAYRLPQEGVRVGHMLVMVEGEDAEAVLEALLTDPSS